MDQINIFIFHWRVEIKFSSLPRTRLPENILALVVKFFWCFGHEQDWGKRLGRLWPQIRPSLLMIPSVLYINGPIILNLDIWNEQFTFFRRVSKVADVWCKNNWNKIYLNLLASLSDSRRVKMSPSLTGPFTLRMMDLCMSPMNSTLTWEKKWARCLIRTSHIKRKYFKRRERKTSF